MRSPRPIRNSLLLLTLVFAAQKAGAQLAPADDFFNSGAQLYISNNIPAALERVQNGRQLYPDDDKLKKLEELLKQKQQQQSQQQQNQKDQSQPQKPQSQSPGQKKPDQSQQQKADDQKKSADQQKQDGQKKNKPDQPKSSADKKDDGKPEDKNGEGQPVAPGQMTPEEARRLLDSEKGGEQLLKWQPKEKPENQKKFVKDW